MCNKYIIRQSMRLILIYTKAHLDCFSSAKQCYSHPLEVKLRIRPKYLSFILIN